MSLFKAFQRFAVNLKGIFILSPLITEPRLTCGQAYHSDYSVTGPRNWSFSPLLSGESWSKSWEHRIWGLVAFVITVMGCREAIFVDKSTNDFPIFLLFFNTKFPIFPIFSILSFLFSYFLEQPCCWTPCPSLPFLFPFPWFPSKSFLAPVNDCKAA